MDYRGHLVKSRRLPKMVVGGAFFKVVTNEPVAVAFLEFVMRNQLGFLEEDDLWHSIGSIWPVITQYAQGDG